VNVLCFLNELSERPPAPDEGAGRNRIDRLLDTLVAVRQRVQSARAVLRVTSSVDLIELAPDYPIWRWRNDAAVPRERRLQLLHLATEAPLLQRGRDADDVMDGSLISDCFHAGHPALALGAARVTDGLGVSLASDPCWDHAWVEVTVTTLRNGQTIEEMNSRVRHASSAKHVVDHERWLRELERLSVKDGLDLWDRRGELFPSLEFCREVRAQLMELRGGDPALDQVMKRLVQLQTFFQSWDGEPIGPDVLPSRCTPESQVTLNKYAKDHTFTAPDGTPRLFSWHVRFTPEPGRIFFDGEPSTRKGLIGYIGKRKLPTVNYPT
jgi:hypothetical protein